MELASKDMIVTVMAHALSPVSERASETLEPRIVPGLFSLAGRPTLLVVHADKQAMSWFRVGLT